MRHTFKRHDGSTVECEIKFDPSRLTKLVARACKSKHFRATGQQRAITLTIVNDSAYIAATKENTDAN